MGLSYRILRPPQKGVESQGRGYPHELWAVRCSLCLLAPSHWDSALKPASCSSVPRFHNWQYHWTAIIRTWNNSSHAPIPLTLHYFFKESSSSSLGILCQAHCHCETIPPAICCSSILQLRGSASFFILCGTDHFKSPLHGSSAGIPYWDTCKDQEQSKYQIYFLGS